MIRTRKYSCVKDGTTKWFSLTCYVTSTALIKFKKKVYIGVDEFVYVYYVCATDSNSFRNADTSYGKYTDILTEKDLYGYFEDLTLEDLEQIKEYPYVKNDFILNLKCAYGRVHVGYACKLAKDTYFYKYGSGYRVEYKSIDKDYVIDNTLINLIKLNTL